MNPSLNPIDYLMEEHQLILKMCDFFDNEIQKYHSQNTDNSFIYHAVEFFNCFCGMVHQNKEEDIFYRELGRKEIDESIRNNIAQFIQEHMFIHEKLKEINEIGKEFLKGNPDKINDLVKLIEEISSFYRDHSNKENNEIFEKSRQYFTDEELHLMMKEFAEFDRNVLREKFYALLS